MSEGVTAQLVILPFTLLVVVITERVKNGTYGSLTRLYDLAAKAPEDSEARMYFLGLAAAQVQHLQTRGKRLSRWLLGLSLAYLYFRLMGMETWRSFYDSMFETNERGEAEWVFLGNMLLLTWALLLVLLSGPHVWINDLHPWWTPLPRKRKRRILLGLGAGLLAVVLAIPLLVYIIIPLASSR